MSATFEDYAAGVDREHDERKAAVVLIACEDPEALIGELVEQGYDVMLGASPADSDGNPVSISQLYADFRGRVDAALGELIGELEGGENLH